MTFCKNYFVNNMALNSFHSLILTNNYWLSQLYVTGRNCLKALYLYNIPVGHIKAWAVTCHEVSISWTLYSVTIRVNWRKLPTTSIHLVTSALPCHQINLIRKHAPWRHRGIGQPDLTVKCHIHISVQTNSNKLNHMSFLLSCTKVEYLQEILWNYKGTMKLCAWINTSLN